jgi:hypothetical protein
MPAQHLGVLWFISRAEGAASIKVRFVHPHRRGAGFLLLTERHGYWHATVDHSAKEYVCYEADHAVHTSTIEAFWSQVKRGINGTYVGAARLPGISRKILASSL